MYTCHDDLNDFLAFSTVLTDFSVFQLQGTGVAELYFDTVVDIVGPDTMNELLRTFRAVASEAGDDVDLFEKRLRADILSDEKLGPVTRNIIKLWFIGTWYQLPQAWRDRFGVNERDKTFIPSPTAYVEGLLWPTIGAHPPGAKAPGYGTWTDAPKIPKSRLPTV
jgi:hypothetical protein